MIDNTLGKTLAISLIERLEGCKLEAYLDSGGVPTLGYGTTHYPSGAVVKMGDTCTIEQAKECLQYHLDHLVFPTLNSCQMPPHIYAAVASFFYNVGYLSLDFHKILYEKEWCKLPTIFIKYTNAAGKFCIGLLRRRVEEIDFMKDEI